MLASKLCYLSLIFFWFLATSVLADESPESQEKGTCMETEWSEWIACAKNMEQLYERSREVCNAAGEPMPLYDVCDPEELLTEWSSWSECSAEWDVNGSLRRTRGCGDDDLTEIEEQNLKKLIYTITL